MPWIFASYAVIALCGAAAGILAAYMGLRACHRRKLVYYVPIYSVGLWLGLRSGEDAHPTSVESERIEHVRSKGIGAGLVAAGTASLYFVLTVESTFAYGDATQLAAPGGALHAFRHAVLCLFLTGAAVADYHGRIIPNGAVVSSLILGVLLAACEVMLESVGAGVYTIASGAAAAIMILFLRASGEFLFGRAGFGIGDVKLAAVVGLLAGWTGLWVLYLGIVGAGAVGLLGMLTGSLERNSTLPFAPFCMFGALLTKAGVQPDIWLL